MAKRYRIPIEENTDGKRTVLFSTAIKDIVLDSRQSMMIYFTPDQPVATLYIFEDIVEIAMWLKSDSTNRVGFVKSEDEIINKNKVYGEDETSGNISDEVKNEESSHLSNRDSVIELKKDIAAKLLQDSE